MLVETEAGSVYRIREAEDGTWWLSGTNVPNPGSLPLPEGEWQIERPDPWPPIIGQPVFVPALLSLAMDDPKRIPGGGKWTSLVRSVSTD